MASMLSAIALLVLATGCFTFPMDTKYPTTTPVPSSQWEMTTGSLFIDNKDSFNMQLMSSQESTDIPNIHHPRILPNGQSTLELTTSTLEESTTGAPSKSPYSQFENASAIQQKRQYGGDNGDNQDEVTLGERQYGGGDNGDDQEETTNTKRGVSDDDEEEITQWKRQYGGDNGDNQEEVTLGERQYGGDNGDNQEEVTLGERQYGGDNGDNQDEVTLDERQYGGDDNGDNQEEATLGERSIDDKDKEETTDEKRQYGGDNNGDDNTERQKREIEDEEEAERAVDDDEQEETERDVEDEEETERAIDDEEEEEETERDAEDEESLLEERVETPTSSSSSFTQTSSTVAPQLYTSDPSNSSVVNFGKYTGLLADDKPAPKKVNKVYQPKKHVNKADLTPTTVIPDHTDDESKAPIAQLDQSGSGKVPNVKSQWLNLEDNNVAPSKLPAKEPTTAMLNDKHVNVQAAPIAQGKQPVQLKEKESDN